MDYSTNRSDGQRLERDDLSIAPLIVAESQVTYEILIPVGGPGRLNTCDFPLRLGQIIYMNSDLLINSRTSHKKMVLTLSTRVVIDATSQGLHPSFATFL